MDKQIKKSKSRDRFQKLESSLLPVAEKWVEYYSDVHKERAIDYPLAALYAVVRLSLNGIV